jgi:hypothetical protein
VKVSNLKTCRVCKSEYTPAKMGQKVCSPACAMSLAISTRGKAEKVAAVKDRRETKAKLDKLKSKATWAREAQTAFNAFIRARDAGRPCISCGRQHQGQIHAGHYLSVGARPELRFEPLNVHAQCAPCNTYLSGNAVLYRKSLVDHIGPAAVAWLEGPHPLRHDTIDDLKAIKALYTEKTKTLKAAQE